MSHPEESNSLVSVLLHTGRALNTEGGRSVNPPLVRASTILFDDIAHMKSLRARRDNERVLTYGARGNPTNYALEDLISELEGGYRTRLFPTGLAAITQMFIAYLRAGDHVLISDSVYEPVRHFAAQFLDRFNISYSFFSADGKGIEHLVKNNTRLIYAECPGSLIYELVDLPALAEFAHSRQLLLAVDNTWGAGYLYRPLTLGADIVVTAPTKYLSGHSDVVMGAVCTKEDCWPAINTSSDAHGMTVSPDDAWMVLRGARTLSARLPVHASHALSVANWLKLHPLVKQVYFPALPDHPNHYLWRRDFNGSNGLLTFALKHQNENVHNTVIDKLKLFGLGASWGGFESLVSPVNLNKARTVGNWEHQPYAIRLHIGLEDQKDLIADLEQALSQ